MSRACFLVLALVPTLLSAEESIDFAPLERSFAHEILPLLEEHCLDCHDAASKKGELDLERFGDLTAIRGDPKPWQEVIHQLEIGEMPPKKKGRVQPTDEERANLIAWTRRYLDAEARAQAGDPGPVVLRRLSNAEYTYTVRDLTGVDTLDPAREFPVDSAAGEGFTNAGGALVMSPALFEKYLEAGKEIAAQSVLLPDGFRFSSSTSRADHANEVLAEIRRFYLDHTGGTDINFSYTSQVRPAEPEGEGEGRLNLGPYFAALLAHRDRLLADPASAGEIARSSGLNTPYFARLAGMLTAESDSGSVLLDHLRAQWRSARPGEAAALTNEVRRWQDLLWKFNKVGHFGLVRPWQEPATPIEAAQEVRLELPASARSLALAATPVGQAAARLVWEQPRFERPGRPAILLRDLEAGLQALQRLRETALRHSAAYLTAAHALGKPETRPLPEVAAAHQLDPAILQAWISYLGLEHDGPAEIGDLLTERIANGGGYAFVKGWQLPGVADFSLLGNGSDQDVRIPGEMRAHHITVHPRPERWIAAGWRSPITGRVEVAPSVRDAHNSCGNGVSWAVELRRGTRTQVLQAGNVDLGQVANIAPIPAFEVRPGDLVSLVIGARDNNHVCDLTEIDLQVRELDASKRHWSLAGDCADTIDAGNPHPDLHGNPGVWHFFGGMNGERRTDPGVVPGSLLDRWLHEEDADRRETIAQGVQEFLSSPLPAEASEADRALHQQLTSLQGPLFSRLDFAELASRQAESEAGPFDADGNLVADAPARLTFPLPSFLAGAQFVTRGVVHPSSPAEAIVQLAAGFEAAAPLDLLQPDLPFVVRPDSPARATLERSLGDFRALFPAAMCYARVVPADEVVTLLLYHREDEPLQRLMLDEHGRDRLDRLWEQLTFVSREPSRLVTAYEQLWQFATQDSDPTQFEPLEEAIRKRAAAFEQSLLTAEPKHLEALLTFAPQAYRRPLTSSESDLLENLYRQLRTEGLSHEDSFHLVLARLFSSAAFLYKAEEPVAGSGQGPVTSWELATRLSYFLTSSAPDAALRAAAADSSLGDPDVLLAHTRRLLHDERARRLAIHFAAQWLHIRDFDQHDEKNERLFPEFSQLRGSMNEEAIRFFTDLIQHDRSLLSVLDADHAFVDAALAEFYGLPAPENGWHRVEAVQAHGRGGILGMAATLAKQSGASRTSPILRGNWVSESLLGEKLPRPPKGVPQLPETVPDGLTERQLIERHSSDPACAKCHARIDPYGFALEHYDAIGRFRAHSDTSATLPDGKTIDGLDGLRSYLLHHRRETFLRNICRKLLGYALGRAVQLSDEPLLDDIMAELAANDYRFHVAVEVIVTSPQFREIRGAEHP